MPPTASTGSRNPIRRGARTRLQSDPLSHMAPRALLLTWGCLLALVSGWGTAGAAQGAPAVALPSGRVAYQRVGGNLQGDVLVLAVNRAPLSDGTRSRLPNGPTTLVTSPQDCEDQCTFTSGCQGWTYCGAAGGCGMGCKAYHAKNGPGFAGLALGCTPVGTRTPISYDSTYGPSRDDLAKYVPDPTVCSGDAWPQHTCTLKTNVSTAAGAAPKLYGGDQSGWVSGTVALAAQCAGARGAAPMTAYECASCMASSDPPACLSCSKALYSNPKTCGYDRRAYWARSRSGNVASLRSQSCVSCACYTKPADAPARAKCYQATKSIGVFGAPDYDTWYKTLQAAAARCPSA